MKYRFLPDIAIADIAFQAYGNDLSELFANAALAVSDTMVDLDSVAESTQHLIELQEKNLDMLLFDFLSEIVLIKDTDNLLFKRFDVSVEEGEVKKVVCTAHGEQINRKKHKLKSDVKAITLHMFEIIKEKSGWKATVVIDI